MKFKAGDKVKNIDTDKIYTIKCPYVERWPEYTTDNWYSVKETKAGFQIKELELCNEEKTITNPVVKKMTREEEWGF